MAQNNERLFDIRTTTQHLRTGSIKRADLEKHLKSLPDDSNHLIETRPGDPDYEAALEEAKQNRLAANSSEEEVTE